MYFARTVVFQIWETARCLDPGAMAVLSEPPLKMRSLQYKMKDCLCKRDLMLIICYSLGNVV